MNRETSAGQPSENGLSEQLGAIRTLYDRWARVYDWNPVLGLVRPARRRAIGEMNLTEGDTVVDMGTGTGANLKPLRDAVGETGTVIGIDASSRMLEAARARVAEHGWDNVHLLEGDIRDPPIVGAIDGICSAFVAVMYDDPMRLLGPWAKLMDDGTMAHLYSGPSRRSYAPAVNALLRGYLRLFDAGWGMKTDLSPFEALSRRGERVRKGVEDLSDSSSHDEFLLGLIKLDVGRI